MRHCRSCRPWPLAVNDLPGGPTVNQLDLHAPATPDRRAAAVAAQRDADHLRGDLRRRVRRDVLFDPQAPQVGRPQGGQLPRERGGRDRLDRRALPHRHRHGRDGHPHGGRDEGHQQCRPHDQGHRLPVEVGLRLPEGRRRGHQVPVDARPGAARAVQQRQTGGRQLSAEGRQPAGRAGRQEDPHRHHGQRRDPRLHGAVARRQAGRDPGLRARHLVPRRQDRRLLRPVRRAVRQGTRLHADPRQGAVAARLRRVGQGPAGRAEGAGRRSRTRSGRWTTWSPAARRSTPPTARPATRPAARAPARSRRWTAARSC